jgi:O-antigen/teichoic acid export membrane protein
VDSCTQDNPHSEAFECPIDKLELTVNIVQKVAYNTLVQLVGKMLSAILALASFGLITRYLGVSGFGAYSLVISLSAFFVFCADLGVTNIGVREITKDAGRIRQIGGNLLTLKFLSAILTTIILLAVIQVLPYDHQIKSGLRLSLIGMFASILLAVPTIVFISKLRMDIFVAIDQASRVIGVGLVIYFIRKDAGFPFLILATVLSSIVAMVFGYLLLLRFVRLRPLFDWGRIKTLFSESLPVGVVVVLVMVHFRIDAVLLSLMRPLSDLGTYSAAYRFSEQVVFIPKTFVAAMFPVLSGLSASSDKRFGDVLQKSFTLLMLIGMPLFVGSFVLSNQLVHLLAGNAFKDSVQVLQLLALSFLFLWTSEIFIELLIIHNLQRRILVLSLAAVVLTVGLDLLLIPWFSYFGPAFTTVIREALTAAVLTVWAVRHGRLRIDFQPLARIMVAALGMGVLVWFTSRLPVIVPILVGTLAYGLFIYLLKVVNRQDLQILFKGG